MRADGCDPAYLLDMLRAAEKIQRYVCGKALADLERDDVLRDALERNMEIVGEAARRVSDPLKQAHPEIPWRQIIAQRNVLAHEYDEIRTEEVWQVATVHIPRLIDALRPLIPPAPPGAGE